MSTSTAPRPDTVMGRALAERVVDLVAVQARTHLGPRDGLLDLTHGVSRPLPEHVRQAAKDALDRGETHYTNRPGVPELRRAIAERSTAQGFPAVADSTVVTNGGSEAIYIALQATLSRGSRAVVAEPLAPNVAQMIRFIGAELVPLSPTAGDRFVPAPADLTGGDVLLLSSPSPLSGVAIPARDLEAIIAEAIERDMTVILDRSNAPCRYEPVATDIDAAALGAQVITIGSFSAGYDLAGWRVGYFTAPEARVAKLRGLKQAMSICTTAVSQFAALAALEGPGDWLNARRDDFAARRDEATDRLESAGLSVVTPDAYPSLLVDTRAIDPDDRVVSERLRAAGVLVEPGSLLGRATAGFIRADLGAERQDLAAGIERIAQLGEGSRP